MAIRITEKNSALVIMPCGELDQHNAVKVRAEMEKALSEHEYNTVWFDLSALDFMDSSGIGVLFGRYKHLLRRRIPVYLTGVKPNIDRMLLMSGIYRLMPRIENDKEMMI